MLSVALLASIRELFRFVLDDFFVHTTMALLRMNVNHEHRHPYLRQFAFSATSRGLPTKTASVRSSRNGFGFYDGIWFDHK
mmetsp:Transcript_2694/g.5631  ORF Transcript_2694/g.5631 Transcript_2694/m.5631 type:complete len:81 (+) Transcript_2694:284-526(+)